MALGQGARPLEGKDPTKVTVAGNGNAGTVVYVMDPEATARLERIDRNMEKIATLLQLVLGGGV